MNSLGDGKGAAVDQTSRQNYVGNIHPPMKQYIPLGEFYTA